MNEKSKRLLIVQARRIWAWDEQRRIALKRAFHHREKIDGKWTEFYECEHCRRPVPRKEKEVEHVNPVRDFNVAWPGWDHFYARLFCPASELRVLCRPCHKNKTGSEAVVRKAYRDEVKHGNKRDCDTDREVRSEGSL